MPLPGAVVHLLIPDVFPPDILAVTEVGSEGTYVFCAPEEPASSWALVAELDTLRSRAVRAVEHGADTLYLRWSEPAELFGRSCRPSRSPSRHERRAATASAG